MVICVVDARIGRRGMESSYEWSEVCTTARQAVARRWSIEEVREVAEGRRPVFPGHVRCFTAEEGEADAVDHTAVARGGSNVIDVVACLKCRATLPRGVRVGCFAKEHDTDPVCGYFCSFGHAKEYMVEWAKTYSSMGQFFVLARVDRQGHDVDAVKRIAFEVETMVEAATRTNMPTLH